MKKMQIGGALGGLALLVILGSPATANEEAVFDAPVIVGGSFDRMNRLIDLDEDDRPDAVGYYFITESQLDLLVYRNEPGTGLRRIWSRRFDGERELPGMVDRVPLAVGDVDGSRGFVVATRVDGLRFYKWSGSFPFLWTTLPNDGIRDLAISDLDGNGSDDGIALLDGELRQYRIPGGGAAPQPTSFPVAPRERITVADLNGDETPDVALWDENGIDLYHWTAGGPVFATSLPTVGVGKLTAGDIDGDDDVDLVYFGHDFSDLRYQVFRRNGSDSFVTEPPRAGGPASDLYDLDGDGDLDGICCGGGGGGDPVIRNDEISSFYISLQDGFGDFPVAQTIEGIGANHLAGVADVDSDGDVDLVAGRAVVYVRDGTLAPKTIPTSPMFLEQAAAVDADHDGDLDVGYGSTDQMFFSNPADGDLDRAVCEYPPPPAGMRFSSYGYPGDWTGDGHSDVIVEMWEGTAFREMRLLRNDAGELVGAGPAAAPGQPFGILGEHPLSAVVNFHALDVDGDGDLDLSSRRNTITDRGTAWLNDGTGFFGESLFFDEGNPVAAADFDDDGNTDVVLQGDGILRMGWGRAEGPLIRNLPRCRQNQLAPDTGDVNGDGVLDVISTDPNGVVLTIQMRRDRSFWTRTPASGSTVSDDHPFRVHYEDLNGDGRGDILVGSGARAGFATFYFLHEGPNWKDFGDPISQVARPSILADFDGDGDLDVLYRREETAAAEVFRNRTFDGNDDGTRRQFGEGLAGTGDRVPVLGAVGPFRPGHGGELRVTRGLGRAKVILAIGYESQESPLRGGTLYVVPSKTVKTRLSGPREVAGAGELALRYGDVRPSVVGRSVFLQAAVADRGATEGLAFSNALEIRFGVSP